MGRSYPEPPPGLTGSLTDSPTGDPTAAPQGLATGRYSERVVITVVRGEAGANPALTRNRVPPGRSVDHWIRGSMDQPIRGGEPDCPVRT
ncbi:hypothetical protein GCM10010306_018910 [Streptomyces umbrinus]|nr:hypothetical protein GCM10010306_018910 [Streptomyces umbrinus]